MKRKLLSSMTALMALLATSCSSDLLLDGQDIAGTTYGDEVEVSFAISTETANAVTRATRAGAKGPGFNQTVGRGSKIDMLIYAVYEKDSVEVTENNVTKKVLSYTLLEQYGNSSVKVREGSTVPDDFAKIPGKGQTIVYDPFGINDKSDGVETNSGSYEFTLRLMRGKEYTIAFWAQSSKTLAYDTQDLTKVKVNYKDAEGKDFKNNDEYRDAFCKSDNFTLGVNGSTRNVILTRPLAQINVGTTGADYYLVCGNPTRFVAYSDITLKDVAQYMNVVTDEIDGENLTNVTFARKLIPGYMNGKVEDFEKGDMAKEEYLYVDLDGDGQILNIDKEDGSKGYIEKYPTLENGKALTETFKYLSMCYVLVPASKNVTNIPNYDASDNNPDNNGENYTETDPYKSTVLSEIEFKFAEDSVPEVLHSFPPTKVTQVPVHRNWRTNILGGLNDKEIPSPDTEEDDNSVFKRPAIIVDKETTFDNDYNGGVDTNKPNEDPTWEEEATPKDSDDAEAEEVEPEEGEGED